MTTMRIEVRQERMRATTLAVLLVLLVGAAHSNGKVGPASPKQIYPPALEHHGPAWFEDVAGKAGIRVLK